MTELVLHEAAVNGEWQTLESMLMIHRIDIDHKDEDFGDRTALHWAASKGQLTAIPNIGISLDLYVNDLIDARGVYLLLAFQEEAISR